MLKENASEISLQEMETRREGSLDLNRRCVKAGPLLRNGTQRVRGNANGERKGR